MLSRSSGVPDKKKIINLEVVRGSGGGTAQYLTQNAAGCRSPPRRLCTRFLCGHVQQHSAAFGLCYRTQVSECSGSGAVYQQAGGCIFREFLQLRGEIQRDGATALRRFSENQATAARHYLGFGFFVF